MQTTMTIHLKTPQDEVMQYIREARPCHLNFITTLPNLQFEIVPCDTDCRHLGLDMEMAEDSFRFKINGESLTIPPQEYLDRPMEMKGLGSSIFMFMHRIEPGQNEA